MDTSAQAANASMNSFIPELAMVPRLFTRSDLVIPIPLSTRVSVFVALYNLSCQYSLYYICTDLLAMKIVRTILFTENLANLNLNSMVHLIQQTKYFTYPLETAMILD